MECFYLGLFKNTENYENFVNPVKTKCKRFYLFAFHRDQIHPKKRQRIMKQFKCNVLITEKSIRKRRINWYSKFSKNLLLMMENLPNEIRRLLIHSQKKILIPWIKFEEIEQNISKK